MKSNQVKLWIVIAAIIIIIALLVTAYSYGIGPFESHRTKLVVSTTTSLYDTGLLDAIEEQFEANHLIDIYFISAGTGIAIQYAQRGDADMILVHAPSKELTFLEDGYGICRKIIAYNFFTIVGPEVDSAQILNLAPIEALSKIVEKGREGTVLWISRGDDSGTHTKEKELWNVAGFNVDDLRNEDWYLESGTGMGKTLQVADEKAGYALADMGTYLKYYTDQLINLQVLVNEGQELLNTYSALTVDPTHNPEVNVEAAITFTKYLVSQEGQDLIEHYGETLYPQQLFYPAVQLLTENTNPTIANWIKAFAYFDGEECPEQYRSNYQELYS